MVAVSVPSRESPSYAPTQVVMSVIQRYRERGLPDPLTPKVLRTVGVIPGNVGRVHHALRYLGLIDGAGRRTEQFEKLRRATSEEFHGFLAEIVRAAYHDVLTIIDPQQDSLTAITDAFRHYEPAAQRDRMVSLFIGLCREAGIGPETRQRRPSSRPQEKAAAPTPRTRTRQAQVPPPAAPVPPPAKADDSDSGLPDYRLLAALLQQLPRDGRWSKDRRERWVQAVTAAVDLLVEVEEVK